MSAETWVPLRVRSNYSFLQGASHPEELVARAADLGLPALALADQGGVYGVVRAHVAAREQGVKLLVGSELTLPGGVPLVLLAPDGAAYGDLCQLLSAGRRAAPKGQCVLRDEQVLEGASRCLAIAPEPVDAPRLARWREAFGDRLHLGLARHYEAGDEARNQAQQALARAVGVPLVVAHDVCLHDAERKPLHDVLTAIRLGVPVPQAGRRLLPNAERRLHAPRELARRYADHAAAWARSAELAARCSFSLDELRYQYPAEVVPPGVTPMGHLRALVDAGARRRYPAGVPADAQAQLAHELALVEQLGYPNYFLTMHEIVAFARGRGILCQGRGSAANSAICFVLGITSVDPARANLLFERFLSPERDEPPDIDVDFEHERREEVIQHVYDTYGRERAAMVAEVVRYRGRSAIRDVGKALGLPPDLVDRMARALGHGSTFEDLDAGRLAEAGLDPDDPTIRRVVARAREIRYFPRHLSIHVGGFVISDPPLTRLVPIENASMEGRTVIQWDKLDVEEAGLLKIDLLALGMLTAIRKTFDLLRAHEGLDLDLAAVPAEDPDTYAMLQAADTVGTFQVESRAQMTMLPRLKPRCFYDLVIEVAIMRPGPIQGRMVHPYLRRRHGLEPITYPHPSAVPVLARTCGVPLFQEQVMKLAVVAAGFTPGEADQLRRAMGTWRSRGRLRALRQKLLDGMRARGIAEAFAQRVVEQIEGFGDYGFPESHAASFAILAYASAWLKRHHTAAFTCALLNSQPMGFYDAHTLVRDAQAHGVEVRPVSVVHSAWDQTLEPAALAPIARGHDLSFSVADQARWAIRLGLGRVRGLRRDAADALLAARTARPFQDLSDLLSRADLPRDVPLRLASAGALDDLPDVADRRQALWRVLGAPGHAGPAQGHLLDAAPLLEPPVELPRESHTERVVADYDALGLSVDLHPIQPLRAALERRGVVPARALARMRHGARATVAGLVLVRQGPATAKGMKFLTLEDETGTANLVITPMIYERFRPEIRGAAMLRAEGVVEKEGRVIHLMTTHVAALYLDDREFKPRSRDFH